MMRSFLSLWMPWQSSMGRLSSSGDSNRSMLSMSGSGVSRCRLLHSLSAGLLVAGVGVPSSCSVTSEDLDLTSWLSSFGESSRSCAEKGGVRSAEGTSNCSVSQSKGAFASIRSCLRTMGNAGLANGFAGISTTAKTQQITDVRFWFCSGLHPKHTECNEKNGLRIGGMMVRGGSLGFRGSGPG